MLQFLNLQITDGCPLGPTAWLILVVFILLSYVLWDVNYFIRIIITIGWARICGKKNKVTDTTSIYGLCTTNDVDIFFRHMNNARYVRELDFARFHFYETTGLYQEIKKAKGNALQSASFIRYRRTIPIFTSYNITTKLLWWDEKTMYLEQQFVTFDGFIRAVVLSKQSVILPQSESNLDLNKMMEILLKKQGSSVTKPTRPEELEHLCSCIDISSQRLRKRD